MKPYSNDLRQRILHAADQGQRQAEIAATFQVSVATSKRYLKQRRETGTVSVKPIPGRPSKYRAALEADLHTQLAAHDDATLEQHCQWWEASHGVRISTDTMRRAIARLGWTRKKRHWVPPSAAKPTVLPGTTLSAICLPMT
jgi:transposase